MTSRVKGPRKGSSRNHLMYAREDGRLADECGEARTGRGHVLDRLQRTI